MKILLTGAGGMLGHAFREVLKDEELIAFGKEELDICDLRSMSEKLAELRPDFLLNCAAYTDVEGAEDNEEEAFKVNSQAALNLLRASNKTSAFLIHFSTDYVFDGESNEGYREDDTKNPINVYGASKAKGEDFIKEEAQNYAIIRTSWLFGPNGKNFVDTMLKLAKERDELNVVNDQRGCPTYSFDLARAVYAFMKEPINGVFHLTNTGVLSWYEFAMLVFKLAEIKITVNPVSSDEFPGKVKRPQNSILLNTKLASLPDTYDALKRYLQL